MTLVVCATSDNFVVQVTDRRLTGFGDHSLIDDEANKTILLSCSNAILSISFTGHASVGSDRLDIWIGKQMVDRFVPEMSAANAVAELALIASDWFSDNISHPGWHEIVSVCSVLAVPHRDFHWHGWPPYSVGDDRLAAAQEPHLTIKNNICNMAHIHGLEMNHRSRAWMKAAVGRVASCRNRATFLTVILSG